MLNLLPSVFKPNGLLAFRLCSLPFFYRTNLPIFERNMGVAFTKQINDDAQLWVWHITEPHNQLLALVDNHLQTDKLLPNNAHWLASRALISQIFKGKNYTLFKDAVNKPYLKVNGKLWFLSITHSANYAAIAFSEKHHIGIDLERIDERVNRVAKKFINEVEGSYAHTTLHKTIIWSAKESLYKLHGQREVDFKQHLFIYPFGVVEPTGVIATEIEKDETQMQVSMHYQLFDEMVLTYCTL